MPILQESQNDIIEFEQGRPILFNTSWSTCKEGYPNLACHCWQILETYQTTGTEDSVDKTGLLHLFKERQSTDEEVTWILLDKEAAGMLDLKLDLDTYLE